MTSCFFEFYFIIKPTYLKNWSLFNQIESEFIYWKLFPLLFSSFHCIYFIFFGSTSYTNQLITNIYQQIPPEPSLNLLMGLLEDFYNKTSKLFRCLTSTCTSTFSFKVFCVTTCISLNSQLSPELGRADGASWHMKTCYYWKFRVKDAGWGMRRLWLLQHATEGHELRLENFSPFHLSVVMSVILVLFLLVKHQTVCATGFKRPFELWHKLLDIFTFYALFLLPQKPWTVVFLLAKSQATLITYQFNLTSNHSCRSIH